MLKKIFSLGLIFILLLTATSCTQTPNIPNTEKIVAALCENEKALPAGRIYSSDLDTTDKSFLSDSLLISYFGEPNIEKYKENWISYSIFIASGNPSCEFAVIYCSTPSSLTDTSRLLSLRLDSIKKSLKEADGRVITRGSYAILIISRDVKDQIKLIRKAC